MTVNENEEKEEDEKKKNKREKKKRRRNDSNGKVFEEKENILKVIKTKIFKLSCETELVVIINAL